MATRHPAFRRPLVGAMALLAVLAAPLWCRADLGPLDPTFGSGGTVEVPPCPRPPNCTNRVSRLVALPDGTSLVLTQESDNRGGFFGLPYLVELRLFRYLANGDLDAAFPADFVLSFSSAQSAPYVASIDGALAVQADGRILVAGRSDETCPSLTCPNRIRIARLNLDGTLDATFGSAGTVLLDGGVKAIGVAALADGKILLAHRAAPGGYRVARFTASGAIDTEYGVGGIATAPYADNGNPGDASRAAFRSDGRAVLTRTVSGVTSLASIAADGTPDPGFNGTGFTTLSFGGFEDKPLVIQRDGRIVLAGTQASGSVLVRILGNGSIDPSLAYRSYADGASIASLAIDSRDRIVGSGAIGGNIALRRWLPDGNDDASFQGTAVLGTSVPGTTAALALLPNTKALVLGSPNRLARFGANALQDDREFVSQQYRDFLSREGDAAGIAFWTSRLLSGLPRAQATETFFASAEFQATTAPVARLYFAYFLRVPDYAGLNYWSAYFRAGNSLEAIAELFAQSPEFIGTYGALDNGQFVTLVYQNVLGRDPDTAGLDFWKQQLDGGALTRGQMMAQFSESAEYRAVIGNEIYVTMMYLGMLRREPDAGGFAFWVGYRDSGNSGLALIDEFLASAEYRGRFMP